MNLFKKIINRPVSSLKIFPIDFKFPWWNIFFQLRKYVIITSLYVIVDEVFSTLVPLILGWILVTRSITLLIVVQLVYGGLEVLGWFVYYPGLTKIYNQVQDSFHFNAHHYLLTVDPIYHVRRSSGMIIGKIKRTATAYFELVDKVIDDLLPFFVEFATVLVTVFFVNFYLGLVIFCCVTLIGTLFTISIIYATKDIERDSNEQDDITSQMSAESVSQVQFIRACFATKEVDDRLRKQHLKQLQTQTILCMTYPVIQGIFILLYLLTTGIMIAFMIHLINADKLSSIMATTLLITYFRGTRKIFSLDSIVLTILRSYRRIKDFYKFIETFGKQTFPVLPQEGELISIDKIDRTFGIHVKIENITLSYPLQTPLFADISLDLSVPADQTNKLFGIIGPSGIGKTTLISIIGGQLKPDSGHIKINDIDIYCINDDIRRQLIAIQGQVATSLRGSLKYNLLFGLPSSYQVEDFQLIELLSNVGLWQLFDTKKGLATSIGEGGMNLSGGQRQRLNFANLYLRAKSYQPLLILIDEPTSSLDEVSELALTTMINELAQTSVTFVIAHRLKTLEEAHGLLDLSLVTPRYQLNFYSHEELQNRSSYFNQLLAGVTTLE